METQAAAREGLGLVRHGETGDVNLKTAPAGAFSTPSRIQMPRHVNDGDSLRSPSQECSLEPG